MRCAYLIASGAVLVALAGCMGAGRIQTLPAKPAKPVLLSITATPEGGITMGKDDTERLMKYILELERGYGP